MSPKLVNQELSQQVVAGAIIAIVLLPIWIPFDYLIDPRNFDTFLTLRIVGILVIFTGLVIFIKTGKQVEHYRKSAMLTYLTLIVSMLPMCVLTGDKLPYYIGFSTVFFAVSILVVWPLRYFVWPMVLAALVLGVTHLHNRRYFDIQLQDELAHALRNGTVIAVLMLDVDHFKKYNDHYGRQQGDECLRQFSACLQGALPAASRSRHSKSLHWLIPRFTWLSKVVETDL